MRLPTKLPSSLEFRNALGEFYNKNSQKQWFDLAEIDENHSGKMKPTLVITANYNPTLEMKEILAFTHKYNLALDVIAKTNQD